MRVKVVLDDRAFACYDVHTHQWRVDQANYNLRRPLGG